MSIDFKQLHALFNIPPSQYDLIKLNHGHINETYKVSRNGEAVYILQKINSAIFTNVEQLMENYSRVVHHLNSNEQSAKGSIRVPDIILTRDGKTFFEEESGYWRMISFIDGREFGPFLADRNSAYEGGRAFGSFLEAISSLDIHEFHSVLSNFHCIKLRYTQFCHAVEADSVGRAIDVQEDIAFVKSEFPQMEIIPKLIVNGTIPSRLTHNDTKLTNVIFQQNGKASGIIDLDTVMPGSALFDFGDAIRSLANTAEEDEPDLKKVDFDLGLFRSFSKGYLSATHKLLTQDEKLHLADSALLMTFIIGMRFLTDYLNGDTYYQVQYPLHNLVRARVQFTLFRKMKSRLPQMNEVIAVIISDRIPEIA